MLTITQYQAHQNRANQLDLLDAANDTAMADMRARIEKLERAVNVAGLILARDGVWPLRGAAWNDTEGLDVAELLPLNHPLRERYDF